MTLFISLFIEMFVCCIFTIFILLYFVRKNSNIVAIITAFFSFVINLVLIAFIPQDIYLTIKTSKGGLDDEDNQVYSFLGYAYIGIYWASFIFSWVFIPLVQEYENSGNISKGSKFKDSIISNLKYYLVLLGIVLVIFVVYVTIKGFGNLKWYLDNLAAFSNLFGLFIVIFLLGNSIVSIPKRLFKSRKYNYKIKYFEYKAERLRENLLSTKEKLLRAINGLILSLSDFKSITFGKYSNPDDLKNSFEIYKEVLFDYENFMKDRVEYLRNNEDVLDIKIQKTVVEGDGTKAKTIKDLVNLNRETHNYELDDLRIQSQIQKVYNGWLKLKTIVIKNQIFEYNKKNNIINNIENSDNEDLIKRADYLSEDDKKFKQLKTISEFKIKYYMTFRIGVIWILFGISIIASAIIIVFEITFSFEYSIYGYIISKIENIVGLHFVIIIPVIYLFSMSMYSLFRLNFAGFYGMYGHRQTDTVSLMFFSTNMCRIGFPICLNLLQMFSNYEKEERKCITKMEEKFGMEISNQFFANVGRFMPLALVIFVFLKYFEIYEKCANALCRFRIFNPLTDETEEDINDGREFLMDINRKNQGELMESTSIKEVEENDVKRRLKVGE